MAATIIPLTETFRASAVVLLRNGTTVSELRDLVREAEEQVASERASEPTKERTP